MNCEAIVGAILNGDADDNLRAVIEACVDRQRTVGRKLFHLLKPGDRVRMVGGQKYLQGAVGTVVRKLNSKVVVDLDEPRGRLHTGIHCPVELLEKITP